MNKRKKQDKIVMAYPAVVMLANIRIKEKNKKVVIGGFSVDGGFYVKEGYKLVQEKCIDIVGENITYYYFKKAQKSTTPKKARHNSR